jgi:hypothetical protein
MAGAAAASKNQAKPGRDFQVLSRNLKGIEGIKDASGKKLDIITDFEKYCEVLNDCPVIADPQTAKAATLANRRNLYGVMADMYEIYEECDRNNSKFYSKISVIGEENINALAKDVNKLVSNYGGDETTHYFRNVMNALGNPPKNLDGMISSAQGGEWKLLDAANSQYHMYGEDGKYNLKFVSKDGIFEAVYDKEGKLLSRDNDPINMGTYNYSNPSLLIDHGIYDVLPYTFRGNAGEKTAAPQNYSDDVEAKAYWESINSKIEGNR